jgi:hypothetical protein
MVKIKCFHLTNGAVIVAKLEKSNDAFYVIKDPLILTKIKEEGGFNKMLLTKYTSFNLSNDTTVKLYYTGLVTEYDVDDDIEKSYHDTIKMYEDDLPNTVEDLKNAKKLLTESKLLTENNNSDNVINIDDLRKNTIKLVDKE